MQLMPILMGDRACRIDASGATESTAAATSSSLGGPIGPVGPIEAVEPKGVSTGLHGRIIPMQPVLRGCRSCRPLQSMQLWHSPQSIQIDLWAL